MSKRYKVTCLNCKSSDNVLINDDNQIIFEGMMDTNFLAGRFRGDMQWGFECRCGNDNRLAASEGKDINKLVYGLPMTVAKIADSLKIPDSKQFSMEAA